MGGPGSGRYSGIVSRSLSDFPKLSIDQVTRLSKLTPGWRGEVGLFPKGSVLIRIHDTSLEFEAEIRTTFVRPYEVSLTLPLIRTPCHFGGHRGAVTCLGCRPGQPVCNRPARTLYIGRHGPLCRRCMGVPYSSQQYDPFGNLFVKLNRLQHSLGGAPGAREILPPKPIGMHERKYYQIANDILETWACIQKIQKLRETRLAVAVEKLLSKQRRIKD